MAWSTLTLVAMPTLLPLILAHTATLFTGVLWSCKTPMAPFLVLFPVASAVPAAAESVTPLVAENVVDTVETGN